MSDVIDQRIVEMGFDNKEFEKGISQSLLSLDKFKDALDFSKTINSFDTITKAIRQVSFDPMVTMWQTALTRMTNYAINAGQRITRALTIEPVFTGFQEYTTQIDAVQTILANTEKYGTTLNDVNKALDELNLYADKTIYNFTQMTANIGRFTAAGLQLDTSVKSIEGMSNLAASSGATAEQASRAYYQMSQALAGVGLRLMDYNSLVNAGMGGVLFQDALKQTARDVKAVTEEYTKLSASGMSNADIAKKFGVALEEVDKILGTKYNADVDEIVKKKGSFRESLSEGWATADILARTFSKFSGTGMVDYLHEFTGVSRLTLEELQEIGDRAGYDSDEFNKFADAIADVTEEQRKQIKMNLKQAQTAEDAATKVKTFAQLKDTVKEAVQSGWTQTWEYIIGDFEEAKEFFTQISDFLGDIIGKYSDLRNDIVGDWSKGGGRQAIINGLWNVVHALEAVVKPIGTAWKNVFPDISVASVLISISEAFSTLTSRLKPNEAVITSVTAVYEKIFTVFDAMRGAVGDLIHLMPRLEKALNKSIFGGVFKIFENTADANYRGKMIKGWRDIYHLLDDMSDMEIKIPGEDDKKGKLANSNAFNQTLKSLASMISEMQRVDVSKLSSANGDISKLNDSFLEMAYGLKNGNDIVKNFKLKDQTDFLKYLQDEFGLEIDIAENVYKTVKKLSEIEDSIFKEAQSFVDRAKGFKIESLKDVAANAVSKIFGISPEEFAKELVKFENRINLVLNRLKEIFATTISGLVTIDLILSLLVITVVKGINDILIKPAYDYIVNKWGPLFSSLYESLKKNVLPILNIIFTGVLDILAKGLQKFIEKFPKILSKTAATLNLFMEVIRYFAEKFVNKVTSVLDALATMNFDEMVSYILKGIPKALLSIPQLLADFFTRMYNAFIEALKLNGVSDKVITVINTIYNAISFIFKSLYNLVPMARKGWEGISPIFNGIFGSVKGFVETNGVSIKNFAAVVIAFIGVFLLIKKLTEAINNTVAFAHKAPFLNEKVTYGPWPFSIVMKPIVEAGSKISTFFDIYGRFTAILDGIQGTIKAFAGFLKTLEVVSIIGSIVALVGAIYLLATLPVDTLITVVGALGSVFILLTVAVVAMTNLSDKMEIGMMSKLMGSLGMFMLSLAAIVGVFGIIETLGGNPMTGVLAAVGLMAAMTLMVTGLMALISYMSKNPFFVGDGINEIVIMLLGLTAMSYAMAPLVIIFGLLDWGTLVQGILALIGICAAMGLFMGLAGKFKGEDALEAGVAMVLFASSIAIISGAVLALVLAVDKVGMDIFNNVALFIGAAMALMIGFVAAVGRFGDPAKCIAAAAAVAVVYSAMAGLALSIAGSLALIKTVFGDDVETFQKIATGFGILTGVLLVLGAALPLLGLIPGAVEVIGIGALIIAAIGSTVLMIGTAVLAFGAGLYLIGKFIETLTNLVKDDSLAEAISERGSLLATIIDSRAKQLSESAASFIRAIHTFLETVLPEISNVIEDILKWLYQKAPVYEAIVFKILVATLGMLNVHIKPALLEFLKLIAQVLDTIFPYLRSNLSRWLRELNSVLGKIGAFIFREILGFLKRLREFGPELTANLLVILYEASNTILSLTDDTTGQSVFGEILKNLYIMGKLLTETLTLAVVKGLLEAVLMIDKFAWTILRTLLVGFISNTLDMLNTFFDEDLPEILDKLDELCNNVIDAIIHFIENLTKTIEERSPELSDAFYNLAVAIAHAILDFFKKFNDPDEDEENSLPRMLFGGSLTAIVWFCKGITESLWKVGNAVRELYLKVKGKFEDLFGIRPDGGVSTDSKIFKFGISTITGFAAGLIKGVSDKTADIKQGAQDISNVIQGILSFDNFKTVGQNIVNGIIEGISSLKDSLKGTVDTVFGKDTGVLAWIMSALDESSPSKATKEMGVFVDKGFESGLISEQAAMMKTVDAVFGEGTGVMEGIRDAVGVHSNSWKTKEYGENVDGGLEDGVEAGENGMLATIGNVFGGIMDKIKGIFSGDESNPISNLLTNFLSDWDPDKGLIANIGDKVSGIFNSDTVQGIFGSIKDTFGNLFGGDIDIFKSLGLTDENGNDLFENLAKGYTGLTDVYKDDYGNGIGEVLNSGKGLDSSVSAANNRTITSNGSYANTMNDMFNSGKYWNDPNALTNADVVNAIATVVQRLDSINEDMPKEVVLDTGAMVGNLTPSMNKALGKMLRQKGRTS